MFGCHNCGKKIKKNTPYAHSPCATCRAEQNPMPQSQYQDDPAGFPTLQVMHPAYMEGGEGSIEFKIKERLFACPDNPNPDRDEGEISGNL